MNSLALLNTALVFHITGIALIAGTTVVDFVTTSRFWRRYSLNKNDGLVMREVSQSFPTILRIGIIVMVLSGISMMTIMHGAYGKQIWMRIKIGLVVLVIVNALVVGRRNGMQLFKLLNEERNGTDRTTELEKVKRSGRLYHFAQLALFLIIFTLSVFKFN